MMKIDIKIDSKAIERRLDDLVRKQLPFATAMAINDSVRGAKDDVQKAMRKAFAGPVPRTINSVRTKLATKAKPEASIWIDREPNKGVAPSRYLAAEILGGPRKHKRFEKALQARGIMPAGSYAVPGAAAPLDSNGNIPGSFIVQLLSYLQAFGEQGYRSNMTARRMRQIHKTSRGERGFKTIGGAMYFVSNGTGRTAHLRPGIYKKTGVHGVSVMPLILFVHAPSYSVRLPFSAIVARSIQKSFNANLRARLDKALATAR